MPVIKIINRTNQPVSTSIGTVRSGRGNTILVPIDLVTKRIVEELEDFRLKRHIDFKVVNDPDIRDDIEQGVTGFYTAVEDLLYFVDKIQGTDENSGVSANAPYETLQKAFDSIPKNVNDFTVYIFLGPGNYSGAIKGITTANNEYDPISDPLSEAYSFLYDSTKNGVVRIVGTTESDVIGIVTDATFNFLQDTNEIFVPGEHAGKTLRIIDGPAAGEIVLIKNNTVDSLEVDFFFNAPEPGDTYEVMRRTSIVDVEAVSCSGLILFDRCKLNIKSRFVDKLGLVNCSGPIESRNSKINAAYHFMGPLDGVDLSTSVCDIGYGSLINSVPRQLVESFSIYSLIGVKLQQCGVAGTHIGTQDYMGGFSIFARHASQVNLFEVDADDCLASFVVLVSSHGWVGQSTFGATTPLPNHVIECYLNGTYNDAGGNVLSSVNDNIKLESGSFSVDAGGSGDGGGGVKIFLDEATLLATSENDGTIAYAELEGSYYIRTFNTWFEHFTPPTPPLTLVGQTLIVADSTLYSAKIPSGLSAEWSALTPGQTISNMIVDATLSLISPDQGDRFVAGNIDDGQASAGLLDLVEAGVVAETYDIATNGVGVISRISITDLSVYNTIWQKANAQFIISIVKEGRNYFQMIHTEAGASNESEFYYDDLNTSPSFASAPSGVINNKISKWLSGIEAWGIGTIINIDYTVAAGIFEKTYHPTQVGLVAFPGHGTSIDNPIAIPAVDDQFVVARTITLVNNNTAILSGILAVTLFKPNGLSVQDNVDLGVPVNTYGTISTEKDDVFFDEDRRIILNSGITSGTTTPFNSSIPLVDGNAQQRHDGLLQFPDSSDYPGFSGDQEYQRFMAKAGASVGALTLDGILNFGNISPYGTGSINILLELAVEGKFFDFGRSIGDNNGTGSGNNRANSKGARNDGTSSGSTLAWSIGTDSTAFNNDEYRVIIIFRNDTYTMARITES